MACTARSPILYRATHLSSAPSSPSSVLYIDSAGSSRIPSPFGAGRKRTFDEISVGTDEETYARRHLATDGSVFFRSKRRSPRSFLWRVLEDRKLLDIQSVDLVHDRKHERSESGGGLTFRIGFKEAIVPDGVQFADPQDIDALECFVLTEGNDLITIAFRRDLLTREVAPKEFDSATCVKRYTSNSLGFRQVYRFVALSSLELVVSLHDGGLLHLERSAKESGTQWRETFYNEGGLMGTLKGLVPFRGHQTVRHGNAELEPSAAAAIAKSPDGLLWTVSLDHTLRAWSMKTGHVIATIDILNERRDKDAQKRQSYVMGAERGTLLQVITLPPAKSTKAVAKMNKDDKYYFAVHSPKDHQFKFYAVSNNLSTVEGAGLKFTDLQPESKLVPPIDELMNTNIWHLEDFYIQPGPDWVGSQLWIRARSGALCRTYMTTFNLLDEDGETFDNIEVWRTGWTLIDTSPLTVGELKRCAGYPGDMLITNDSAVTPSERWLDFLFYPDRFSAASLETALHIYSKGRNLPSTSSRGLKAVEQPLQERLTTAITAKVMLCRLPNEQPDYMRYQQDLQAHWQTFYSLLTHLHSRRHESIRLVLDFEECLAWSVCADYIAPVRQCSGPEMQATNAQILPEEGSTIAVDLHLVEKIYPEYEEGQDQKDTEAYLSMQVGRLMAAARNFRRGFSSALQDRLRVAATQDALQISNEEAQHTSLPDLFERLGFEAEVTDDDFEALNVAVEPLGGLGNLEDLLMLAVLELADKEGQMRGLDAGYQLTRYGVAFTVAVAQETLLHTQSVLLDILALAVFMAAGLETDELHPNFHPEEIYAHTLWRMKQNELLLWLVRHQTMDRIKCSRAAKSSEQETELEAVTVLEYIFISDWRALTPRENLPISQLLTIWSKIWINGPDIQSNWDGTTGHIMAILIQKLDYDLAVDFMKYLDESPWARYLKGRLHLANSNYEIASLDFQAAAEGIEGTAHTNLAQQIDTAHLLTPEERQYFGAGLSKYFQHVSTLFEKAKAYSYGADFARLALQNVGADPEDLSRSMAEIDSRKRNHDSPAGQRVDDTMEEIRILKLQQDRDEILNRLFNALVLTGRFNDAYEAVQDMADQAAQRSNLRKLIETCVKQDAVPDLLELPLHGDLVAEADRALAEMSKKAMADGVSFTARTPYYQVLYAFRTQRANFRGAAEVLYEHLERLRESKDPRVRDPEDDTLLHSYLLLINTLACCGEDDAWLLAERIGGVHTHGAKRKLIRLEDVRREYAAELDRRSNMLQGRFPLVGGGDEMDVL